MPTISVVDTSNLGWRCQDPHPNLQILEGAAAGAIPSSINSRVYCLKAILYSCCVKHLIAVSTKPAAAHGHHPIIASAPGREAERFSRALAVVAFSGLIDRNCGAQLVFHSSKWNRNVSHYIINVIARTAT